MTGAPLPLASEPSGMRAWLLSPEPDAPHGNASPRWAPHEQLGRLPAQFRETYRCGVPKRDGQPCRTVVAERGQSCAWHKAKATA